MRPILTAAQNRAFDRHAIDVLGVPGVVLMETAGRGVAAAIERALVARGRSVAGARVVVVCGAGQNGGDGFVIARHLAAASASVTILLAFPRAKITGDAAVFAAVAERMPQLTIVDLSQATEAAAFGAHLAGADVVVDAVFGTGLRADVTGTPAAAIDAMNECHALRVAVDLPSGLDADTGRVRGRAVRADVTVTMAALKPGLVLEAGGPAGEVEVVSLGVPLETVFEGPRAYLLEEADARALLPPLAAGAHKGTRGHVLVVAGSAGKTGAALLSGRAALRAGAGLVTLAAPEPARAALDVKVVELMTASYTAGVEPEPPSGAWDAWARLEALTVRKNAVAIGPGIPTGEGMRLIVERAAAELALPMVLDADGLNLLGTRAAALLSRAPAARVLTPHPGEMARLVGGSIADVQADRLGAARRLAADARAIVVLKGARTVVAEPDGTAYVNPAANAALGTAGSGDVLTGVIAALLGRGLPARDAALVGVFAHGEAGAIAAASVGAPFVLAGELPDAVARVLGRWLGHAGG